MPKRKVLSAYNSGASIVVSQCQVCGYPDLEQVLFLGYLPPVNKLPIIGQLPCQQESYPALLLYCPRCQLVQLGLIVDPKILFPREYPYTSGTTRILRENFTELYNECSSLLGLKAEDLVVDIGCNDGTLLSNFIPHARVLGITPEDIGKIAVKRGIPVISSYFNKDAVKEALKKKGRARVVTATNVLAHMEDIHQVMDNILKLLKPEGIFISESHYLISLLETLQYDTIYHEHLRYYSLQSLKYLLETHGLQIVRCKRIPTHGGSLRVYAARKGCFTVDDSVAFGLRAEEEMKVGKNALPKFKEQVVASKLGLLSLLAGIKEKRKRIYGISAPSRASTLINYAGLNEGIIDCVLEVPGSHKIGRYVPGTLIPIEDESRLFKDQPEYALLLSWHIADELIPKLKSKGFKGDFIIPLPRPRIAAR